MSTEAARLHRALEAAFERLFAAFDEARLERRGDLLLARWPGMPIPQCNGPWVCEDTPEAAEALVAAVDEVDAIGMLPWVQIRRGHERTGAAARALGLTHSESVPGMFMCPGELAEPSSELEVALIADDDVPATTAILAEAFGAPKDLFDRFCAGLRRIDGVAWYVGRSRGELVTTALGFPSDDAIGIFDVATPPAHRGRGYGAAITAHVIRDGFSAGAAFAYLQSSDVGHSVYRRLGFRDVEEYTLLTRAFPG